MASETRYLRLKEYANQVIFDVLKAFWDERGLGARFRLYNVGKEHFLGRPRLSERDCTDLGGAVAEVARELAADGVAEGVSVERSEENVLTINVKRCIHRPVEDKLMGAGVSPFFCPCTNLVMALAEHALGVATEQACIEVEGDECRATIVLFKRPAQAETA